MWETVKLGEAIDTTETVNPASNFPNETFEYIDVSCVSKEHLVITETQILLGKNAPSRARRRVCENDVIFATIRPTLKRVAVIPSKLDGHICSTGFIVLRGKKQLLLPKYLFYWMTSKFVMDYVEAAQTGASYPAVTDKQVKNIDILLPPLAEQQRIVAKLDAAFAEIDRAIEVAESKHTEVEKLKAALLSSLLRGENWETAKLRELCDIQSGLWKGKKEPFTKALVLRNTNFTAAGKFDYSNVVELEVETKQLSKREVIKDDIILEKSGGGDKTPVGRVCIHDAESDTPFSLSNFTARIRVIDKQQLDAQFLHRFLFFLYMSGKTEPMQRHSTGIRNLQLAQYKEIDVPLPPLTEQQRIVAKLDVAFAELDRANASVSEAKTHYQALKSAILAQELQPPQSEAA